MLKSSTSLLLSTLSEFLLLGSAWGTGIPLLNLHALTDSADVIAVGKIQSVTKLHVTTIVVHGQIVPATLMASEIVIDKALKGDPKPKALPFNFPVPDTSAGGIGYPGIDGNTYRIVFLKRNREGFGFADPYYPSFPAVPDMPIRGTTAFDRVISELAAVIQSPQMSASEKIGLLFKLQQVDTPNLRQALKTTLSATDKSLQLSVAAALLQRNDISGLGVGEQALIHPPPEVQPYVLQNLSSAIARGLKDVRAVPSLGSIAANAPDVKSRRAATSALRNSGSPTANKYLVHALNDGDLEVRYYAVIALAEINGQNHWRPLHDEYQFHEHQYLTHWQDWASKQPR